MDANAPSKINLYKIGRSGKAYPKKVLYKDWKSEAGYEPIISSSSEHETETTKGIQKWMFVISQFPQNPAIRKIAQSRIMELVDVSPEELKEIQEAEDQSANQIIQPTNQQVQANQPMAGINKLTNAQ
jgi:hypothetical protein